MKERVITALSIIAVVLLALYLGNSALYTMLFVLLLIASYEIYSLKSKELKPILLCVIIGLTLLGSFSNPLFLSAFTMMTLIILFSLTVVYKWFHFEHVSYIFILMLILVLAIHSVRRVLEMQSGTLILLFILYANYMTDTAAFFGGKYFGKHKLIERISPKKTVEGSVVGYSVAAVSSLIIGIFGMQQFVPLPVIVGSALFIPLLGQFGDLAFSLVKRHFNIKDFGTILPGHGGVLDRVDSAIFALFVFNTLMMVFA